MHVSEPVQYSACLHMRFTGIDIANASQSYTMQCAKQQQCDIVMHCRFQEDVRNWKFAALVQCVQNNSEYN